ncbi:hypothetical protein BKI52_01440 [marine bacterium AO1-C]|nr:hypothetical protein BKI52_01440 [marine bacterium AO1-C]
MKIIITFWFWAGLHLAAWAQPRIIQQQKLPGINFDNHRIFLAISGQQGQTIKFYTDTGGGRIMAQSAVQKMGIEPDTSFVQQGKTVQIVNLAPYFQKQGLPSPVASQMAVVDFSGESEGLLGASWFANKVWNFDYLNKTLSIVQKLEWPKVMTKHQINLGFQKDKNGQKTTHFPRIPIVIEGDTLQVLLDTGAMANLSNQAQKKLNHKVIGASFIVRSIFNQWRQKHPEWLVIEKGNTIFHKGKKMLEEDLIQVPKVTIGGYEVGPVWFASRRDQNFSQWMSQWMDQKIVGAIGGSGFQYFQTIIVDYNQERAYFKK